ncbi:MAG TPA: SRPBCC domain-containing protein [Steroidobacteraceae bacterium]|nr:SRPBCC domain-containing protein [Steroidobacteraceae bacterium]
MSALPHRLKRSVLINAERSTVFGFFTDSALFASWWGAGSTIEPRPGGRVVIRYPNSVVALGTVEALVPDQSIVFTYGYEKPDGAQLRGHGIAPGASRVSITLRDSEDGTVVDLEHEFETPAQRDMHDPGWRFQLSLFANVAAKHQHAAAPARMDTWFAAWNESRSQERLGILRALAEPTLRFRDGFAAIAGIEELSAHIGATHMHMPGISLRRAGEPRECQGMLLVDWIAARPDGKEAARGTNYVSLSPRGRVREVIGFR